MGREGLAGGGDGVGADQHKGDHAGFAGAVKPVVNGSALDQKVADLFQNICYSLGDKRLFYLPRETDPENADPGDRDVIAHPAPTPQARSNLTRS